MLMGFCFEECHMNIIVYNSLFARRILLRSEHYEVFIINAVAMQYYISFVVTAVN